LYGNGLANTGGRNFPKNDMLADHFTKPLQGSLCRSFHDAIMNAHPKYEAFKPVTNAPNKTSDVSIDQRSVIGSNLPTCI